MKYSLLFLLLLFLAFDVSGQEMPPATKGKLHVGRITISGNNITQRDVILRELSIREESAFPADSLAIITTQNRERLLNLQLFNLVDQKMNCRNDSIIDWYITVQERWYYIPTGILQFADRDINTWWVKQHHDIRRVTAGVTLTDINFRGNLEQLAVTVQGGYTEKLGISYLRPYVNKDKTHGIGFVADVARSREAYYATVNDKLAFAGTYSGPVIWQAVDIGARYVYRPAYASRHLLQLSYNDMRVGDTIVKLNADYYAGGTTRARYMELLYRYEYNKVDNWSYPLKGFKLVNYLMVRQGFEGVHSQKYVNGEAGYFCSPAKKWYTAIIFRGKLMYPQDEPYYFRGGLGMQREQVRGYEYYVVDGYNYGILRLDLKRELFNKQYSVPVKYVSTIPVRLYPKIFFDMGYTNNPCPGNNVLPNTLLYSFGAGLDIVTLYDVKMRVEFARNHLGQNGLYLHFNSE
jgi:outer membrane protein assembly factor BamA